MRPGLSLDEHVGQLHRAIGYMNSHRYSEAEAICRDIISKDSKHSEANHIVGVIQSQRGEFADAARYLATAVRGRPKNAAAHANLGAALSSLGRLDDAAQTLKTAIALNPSSAEARNNLALVEVRRGNLEVALEHYHKALKIDPNSPQLNTNLAHALVAIGEEEQAVAHYQAALIAMPKFVDAHYGLAQALRTIGEIDRAKFHYERAIELDPNHANAMLSLSMIADRFTPEQTATMRIAYDRAPLGSEQRMLLGFALGRVEDANKKYFCAAQYYTEANSIRHGQLKYSIEKTISEFREIISVFNRKHFSERVDFGNGDRRPIFIVGMPRSGTSLVEQILASHSHVTGLGELPTFPQAVFGSMQRIDPAGFPRSALKLSKSDVDQIAAEYLERTSNNAGSGQFQTDKLPANFIFLGMIRLVFPNAKIIHCTRDTRDTCVSLFRTFFPSGGHHYSYDFETLLSYHGEYRQLMEHWTDLFDDSIIDLNYETLVLNPDTSIRRLLSKLELEFENGCLEFHNTRRIVRTASAGQVRKPMFTTSIGGWKRYELFFSETKSIPSGNAL